MLLHQPMRKLAVPAQLRRHAVEEVDAIDACEASSDVPFQTAFVVRAVVLMRWRTSSQVSLLCSESGVPMMRRSLSPHSFKKSGHSAGHCSRGTLTSQNGSGSSCAIPQGNGNGRDEGCSGDVQGEKVERELVPLATADMVSGEPHCHNVAGRCLKEMCHATRGIYVSLLPEPGSMRPSRMVRCCTKHPCLT